MVDLGDGLDLVPLVGHKVCPPYANWCSGSSGRGLSGTYGLIGRQ